MSLSTWPLPDMADLLAGALRLPIMVAPMFLISGPELVIASARAGVIGAFPAPNARTIDDLATWLDRITGELALLGVPDRWAINLIVHPSYERLEAELALICRHRPAIVITALGSPLRVLPHVHRYGGKVYADVVSVEQARKVVDAGVDGLVLVASGAGGHTGRYSAFAFVEEVRDFWAGPLILGGAIGSARGLRAALTLGADLGYMGTRFIAARESLVTDDNRAMLVRAGMSDIVTTAAITGVSANWLRESLDRAGVAPETLRVEQKIDFSNLHGDTKAWKSIWGAGQSVGRTRAVQSVAEIVAELAADYAALSGEAHTFNTWPKHGQTELVSPPSLTSIAPVT